MLRSQAHKEYETIKVDLVAFNAFNFQVADEAFSDEEIETHFLAYRDRVKGKGIEFGYHQPASVMAEYIKIDLETVAENVHVRAATLE